MQYKVVNRFDEVLFEGNREECYMFIMNSESFAEDNDEVPEFMTVEPSLPEVTYPGGGTAYYDAEEDCYYNVSGQRLKQPSEYNWREDGIGDDDY